MWTGELRTTRARQSKRSVRSQAPSSAERRALTTVKPPGWRAHSRGAASGLIPGVPGTEAVGALAQRRTNRETRASLLADFAMWRVVVLNHNRCPHNTDAPDVVTDIRGHVCTPLALKGFSQKARHSADRKGACL